MSRLQADLCLALVALIWGAAFLVQKLAAGYVEAFTFVAARFVLSALVVLPLALKEQRTGRSLPPLASILLLSSAFAAACLCQQIGTGLTSVTNISFITALYVIFVPLFARAVFRQTLGAYVWPATLLSLAGATALALSHGGFTEASRGDLWVLVCAVGFGLQVALMGHLLTQSASPFRLSFIQYAFTAIAALIGAMFEPVSLERLTAAWPMIAYAGIISGGVAHTLQAVAQRHTPSPDAAIVMSSEALVGALAGVLYLDESLSALGFAGCSLIVSAIILVEAWPLLERRG